VILLRTALQLCNKITAGVCAGQSAAPGCGEIICYGVTDFREKILALQRRGGGSKARHALPPPLLLWDFRAQKSVTP